MTNRKSGLSTVLLLGLVTGLMFCRPLQSLAQAGSASASNITDLLANPLEELQRRLSSSAYNNAMLPMEGAVDPDEYVVGPGDVFSLSLPAIRGAAPESVVGADGRLLIPDVGPVMVGGLTLTEARTLVLGKLKDAFQRAPVEIVLVQSRQFYVHVSGAVPSPGRYLALPVARVATVLEAAYADTTWAPVSNRDLRPSLRNIKVIHVDGTESSVDLLQYFASGNTDANPYLRDGDVIYVAAFDPAFESIYIDGAVLFPGPYDFRPGDTLHKLIGVAGGFSAESSIEKVRIRRDAADGSVELFTFDLSEVVNGGAGDFELNPRDHVSIARLRDILGSAAVEGMVSHPGTYPIQDGITTVLDLIDKSGGLRDDALARGAYLERRALPAVKVDMRRSIFEKPVDEIAKVFAADSTEIMQRLRMTDMDFLSRAYFALEVRMQNRVSVDLENILAGTSSPPILRDGDRLVIPRDDQTVYVVGQVRRPGFVGYREGMDGEYYISAAGGRGGFADEVVIINPASNAVERLDNQIIRSGDTIFIDRKTDVAENSELQRLVTEQERARSDARIRTMQTVLQSVTTVASVIAIIVSIRRN